MEASTASLLDNITEYDPDVVSDKNAIFSMHAFL